MFRGTKAVRGRVVSILPLHQGQMSNDIMTGSEQVFKADGLERFLVSDFSEI
jgi:hypothetical protein